MSKGDGLMAVSWAAGRARDSRAVTTTARTSAPTAVKVAFRPNDPKGKTFIVHCKGERAREAVPEAVRRDLAAVFGADVVDAHLLEVYHKAWINARERGRRSAAGERFAARTSPSARAR